MHSKMKFADWTCPGCKAGKRTCADVRSWMPASSRQASATVLSAPGNTTQCQEIKPAASDDRKEMESLSLSMQCSFCGNKVRREEVAMQDRNYTKRENIRCKGCAFPVCKSCGRKRREEEGPLGVLEIREYQSKQNGDWYCNQDKCQSKKTVLLLCNRCKSKKPPRRLLFLVSSFENLLVPMFDIGSWYIIFLSSCVQCSLHVPLCIPCSLHVPWPPSLFW